MLQVTAATSSGAVARVEKTQGYARQFRRGLLRNSSQIVAQPAAVTTSNAACRGSILQPSLVARVRLRCYRRESADAAGDTHSAWWR
jgi:hypothetical protein